MYQPIEDPVDALVDYRASDRYPLLRAFRWRNHRFEVDRIDAVRRCPSEPMSTEEQPRSYGHFSSRWVRNADTHPPPVRDARGSLCYRVRSGQDGFELRLDLDRLRWILEAIIGDEVNQR
jgi:hypothetical protein